MIIIKKCKICKRKFESNYNNKKYCSKECYIEHKAEYDREWRKRNPEKKKIYKIKTRAKICRNLSIGGMTWKKYGSAEVCEMCGSRENVQHHHFIPYHVDNFIDVCRVCHLKLHGKLQYGIKTIQSNIF